MPSHLDTAYAALLLDEEEEYEDLIARLSEYIATASVPGFALHNRAVAQSEIGRVDEVLADFDRAANALPGNYMPLKVKGAFLNHLGRLQEALQSLDRAVEMAPREATLLRTRAHVREKADLISEATEHLERASAVEPGFQVTITERSRLVALLKQRNPGQTP